jgi:hypothetical protein
MHPTSIIASCRFASEQAFMTDDVIMVPRPPTPTTHERETEGEEKTTAAHRALRRHGARLEARDVAGACGGAGERAETREA